MSELIKVAESQRIGALVKKVNSFAELRNYEPELDKEAVTVLGGSSYGDINAGIFRHDSTSVLVDDNLNTIVTVEGARWRRVVQAYASASQGSKADSAVQPGNNVSVLANDADYATQSDLTALTPLWQSDIAGALESNLIQDIVAPTAVDDFDAGYRVNSRWFNTTTGIEYICLDATPAAAVWVVAFAGSGPTLLNSTAITAVASIDLPTAFSANPGYEYYRVVIEAADWTGGVKLYMLLSIDGSTFSTTAADYDPPSVEGIDLGDVTSASRVWADILFTNAGSNTGATSIRGAGSSITATTVTHEVIESAFIGSEDDITGFRIRGTGAGAFVAGGFVKVYGSSIPF
jgi:hypothetical protein